MGVLNYFCRIMGVLNYVTCHVFPELRKYSVSNGKNKRIEAEYGKLQQF